MLCRDCGETPLETDNAFSIPFTEGWYCGSCYFKHTDKVTALERAGFRQGYENKPNQVLLENNTEYAKAFAAGRKQASVDEENTQQKLDDYMWEDHPFNHVLEDARRKANR